VVTLLRIYEGCARSYVGIIEGANIIKMNLVKPKISYLLYPDFDKIAHPELLGSVVVSLDKLDVKFYDYSDSENSPILHRKEEFVPNDYPFKNKFRRLTKKEEELGLYENPKVIGHSDKWNSLLKEKAITFKGHRVIQN